MEFVDLIVGLYFWGVTLAGYVYVHEKKKKGAKTTGTVIDLVKDESVEGFSWHPMIAYSRGDGTKSEFLSKSGSFPTIWSKGDTVEIMLIDGQPEHFDARVLRTMVAIGIVGGSFAIAAAFHLILPPHPNANVDNSYSWSMHSSSP